MKNKVLFLLTALSLCGIIGWGQATPSKGNPARELREALSGLAPERIATGVLLNRMMFMTDPHRFAGQGDTTTNYRGFKQQYWGFYHAALDSTTLLSLDALRANIANRVQQGAVPLLMLSYRYNEFSATAAQDNLITIDSVNERVMDGPDLSRSPYLAGQFFSAVLPLPAIQGLISIYIGPEFWLGNTAVPAALSIDFSDGLGPRKVKMGSTIEIQVAGSGNGPEPQGTDNPSTSRLIRVVDPTTGFAASTTATTLTTASVAPDVALGVLASRAWPGFTPTKGIHGPGGRATAIAWIKYADTNTAGKLRRPLVFVEGIDFDVFRNPKVGIFPIPNHYISGTGPLPLSDFDNGTVQYGGYRNGAAGWNEMVDYNAEYKSLEKFPTLRAQLQAPPGTTFPGGGTGGNYDIIYLDFTDGASLIQDNAMVLAELLELINQPANRTPDAEETMVIGASMGGQVARFALAWMEQQGLCHNSKLYVSFDSPHRGANVPLGIQHMFDRLQGIWIGSGSAQDAINNKLLREATMQMAVFHFNFDAARYRNPWQGWQASPGSYPSLLRKVAIANGSGQAAGNPGDYPGMEMLHTYVQNGSIRSFTEIIAGYNYAYALPGASSRGHDNVVFRYLKPYSLTNNWRYTYADPSWGYYDTAPGSSESTAADAHRESSSLVAVKDNNTFMATVSALDIRDAGPIISPNFSYNVRQQIPADNQPNRTKYAFDAYFAAGSTNEPHVQITNGQGSGQGNPSFYTDNSSWIQNELRESAHRMPAVLTSAYNYGSPYRHLLPSVQVNGGGQLTLNLSTRPAGGGTPATQTLPPAGNFDVYTSSCPTVVQLNSGGLVLVGETGTGHTASLQISANSLLDLRTGGRLDVAAGSVLHIVAGGTLVVRSGATLNLYGQVLVDAGAYLCVEDQASIVVGGSGTYTVSPNAIFSANPALNLGPLACTAPTFPPLSVAITLLRYTNPSNYCTSPSRANNRAEWTAEASGGNGFYTFTWFFDATGTGNNYVQQSANDYTVAGNQTTFGTCLNGYTFYVTAKVVVNSGTQQSEATYYATPQRQAALYPNPADEQVEVGGDAALTVPGGLTQPPTGAARTALPTGPAAPMRVTVYSAQGNMVFTAAAAAPTLLLDTRAWPSGLYEVTIQRDAHIERRQLSVQH